MRVAKKHPAGWAGTVLRRGTFRRHAGTQSRKAPRYDSARRAGFEVSRSFQIDWCNFADELQLSNGRFAARTPGVLAPELGKGGKV